MIWKIWQRCHSNIYGHADSQNRDMGIPCNPRLSKSPLNFFSGWFFSRLPRSLGRRATSLKLAFSRSLRSLKTYERPTCSKSTVTQSQVAKVIWKGDAYMNRVLGMGMSISLYQRREKDKKSLSSTPARLPNLTTVLEPGAGQGIPYPDRGA